MDEPKLPHAAYLGVGALAGQYCREHVCDNVPELNQLLTKLAKNIENPTKEKEHLVSVLFFSHEIPQYHKNDILQFLGVGFSQRFEER